MFYRQLMLTVNIYEDLKYLACSHAHILASTDVCILYLLRTAVLLFRTFDANIMNALSD